jgi:Cd2+/Zn2+-exporting ATPase
MKQPAVSHQLKNLKLLPEDKVRIFEKLIKQSKGNGKTAFVGDGINDAPVLARADVGVAMKALGSDAAVETADVVLMNDSPMKMTEAVSIAKQTRRIVWQNIFLAFTVKGIFILFGVIGMATMREAVFADMGTALLEGTPLVGPSYVLVIYKKTCQIGSFFSLRLHFSGSKTRL